MIWTIIKAILLVGLIILAGIGAVSCIMAIGIIQDEKRIKEINKKQD